MNPEKTRTSRMLGVLGVAVLLVGGVVLFALTIKSLNRPVTPANGSPLGVAEPGRAPIETGTLDAVVNAAQEYLRRDEAGKAEAILSAAIREHPEEQRLYVAHAETLAALKRLEEAYAEYERALAIGPRDGEVEFAAGTVASMIGKPERAVEHFQAAQQSMKTDPRPSIFLAQVQVKLHRNAEAAANLALAARLNPDLAVIWGTWAQIELDANRPSVAQQHAEKARELEPRVTLWRILEARALLRQQKAADALALLEGLDDSEKRDPAVLGVMGESLGLLNRPAEAASLYVRAAQADRSNGPLALEAALWLERAGDKAGALEQARHAAMLAAPGAKEVADRLAGSP